MKQTKKSLISSAVALLLCFAMLLSTTYAWFTDSAVSERNIIQSGNLDVEMYWSETFLAADSDEWKNADGVPIFTYDNWEPGYTDVKYVKVKNAGNLSLQWRLSIEAEGEVTELADVIDVYYINPVSETVSTLSGKASVGVLSNVIDAHTYTSGVLLPAGEVSTEYTVGETILAIAFHMQEDAGNAYQGKSIGDGFAVSLIATQFSYESDSFDKDYDKEPQWPSNVIVGGNSATATVVPDANNEVSSAVSLLSSNGKIDANVPVGVKLEQGVDKLTLNVSDVANSQANISLSQTEASLSIDVHIDGVAQDNDVVMAIGIKELLPIGLNMGNYRFYHVENGDTVEMILLADGATPVHNNYEYDPSTGDVVLYLKSFSEVALVADTVNAWNGTVAIAFAGGDGTEADPYLIANADQLAYMSQKVSTDEIFASAHYKLISDVNFGGENNAEEGNVFYPIGYWAEQGTNSQGEIYYDHGNDFSGTFDGNGNTVSNIYQNTWLMDGNYDAGYYKAAMGLFGAVFNATVKNVTIDNFRSDGEFAPTGCIAAFAGGKSVFENISLTNCNPRVYNTGNGGIVGLNYNSSSGTADELVFRNITVDQTNTISALWGSYDVSCGGILGRLRENSKHDGTNTDGQKNTATFENCHVAAVMDVNNDVCANYQYYQYRYAGMLIGTVDYIGDVPAVGLADVVTTTNCTVTYGDWNEYWYCELVKNSLASYTHDHQFSRLVEIESIDEIKNGDTWLKEGNFVLPNEDNSSAECYHIFKDADGALYQHLHDEADATNDNNAYETVNGVEMLKEDRTCYYIPFGQLFTGYGWGSSPVYEYSGVTVADSGTVKSESKFESINNTNYYKIGTTITLGDLVNLIVDESKLSKSTLSIFVSPYNEGGVVNADVSVDTGSWADSAVTFKAGTTGAVKIVITDYFYCTKTEIVVNEADASAKFTASSLGEQNAYTQITLGNVFGLVDGVTLGNVTATVTDPNGNKTTVSGTSSDWDSKTVDLIKDGDWTVVIQDDDAYCAVTTATFTVNKADKFENKFTGDFLYRVGNQNTVALGSLFGEIETAVDISSVNVEIETDAGNASGTFTFNNTWTNGTIQFTGTGVVTVTISADGANKLTLTLEVVDANNATTAASVSGGKNIVLLKDVAIASNGSITVMNGTLYGNGFTVDATDAAYSGTSDVTSNCVLYLSNGIIDNVIIKGAVYTTLGAMASSDYSRALVLATGTSVIANSYLSNCASPLRVKSGTVEVINTTLSGGIFSNLDIRDGNVILDNVTTINQVNSNDTSSDGTVVVGFGITVYYESVTSASIEIRNGLTQYNALSQTQANTYITDSYAKQIVSAMFDDSNAALQYTDSEGVKWVNTGVLFASTPGNGIVYNDEVTGYSGYDVTIKILTITGNGKVYTLLPTAETITKTAPDYVTMGQYTISPAFSFDYTSKNYLAKEEGSNDYCYYDGSKVLISMDEGDSYSWDPAILTVSKYGQTLDYTVMMDDVDYTDSSIVFDTSGTYTIVYSYTDPYNYATAAEPYGKSYTKTVTVYVSVMKPEAKHAEFTFGSDGTASKSVTIGDNTYVMPDVTATSDTIGSITVNGTTVYYPIVEGYTSDGATAHSSLNSWYMCFPVFKDAVAITDYESGGTGNAVTYNSSTTSMPSGLSLYSYSAYQKASNGVPSGAISFTTGGADVAFKYAASSSASTTPTTLSNVLIYASPTLSNNARDEFYLLVTYKYQDNAGATYYYVVGYHTPETTVKSVCVTPDTLVTLADGTQKRIDQVTYEDQLLVWDFFKGEYTVAPSSIIFNHGYDNYRVLTLNFEDDITVKVITNHGFYHAESDSFVFIDEENVESYIGSDFVRMNGDSYDMVKLIGYSVTEEYTGSYSIQTAMYNNFMVEGMFSITEPEFEGWFDYFEIGEDMKYDEAKMQADIEKYGLYTYEEFAEYVTYEQFIAFNGPYLKVLVGRGVVTYDQIIELISVYVNPAE